MEVCMIKVKIVHVCDQCGDEAMEDVHLTEVKIKKDVAEFQCGSSSNFLCLECLEKKIEELKKSGKATNFMPLI